MKRSKFLKVITLAFALMIGSIGLVGLNTAYADDVVPLVDLSTLTTTLTAPSKVEYNKEFSINMGLQGVTRTVYAQEITVQYDVSLMEFVSVESLIEGVSIIDSVDRTGSIRLIVASLGAGHGISTDTEIATIHFRAKALDHAATGAIQVLTAVVGDENGFETVAGTSSVEIAFYTAPVELSPDINGDGKVSIGDLAIVASNYGKTEADVDWDQVKHMDLDGDKKIDIVELTIIARQILEM
ncbi:cohesin domain-containing protein [Paenibacillus sp. CMAA1364]